MLVVTRRPGEKITFPALGITVHLLRTSAGAAKVGVEAPPDVLILRDELVGSAPPEPAPAPADRHAQANALSRLTLAIHLARKQWAAGRPEAADATLAAAIEAVSAPAPPAAAPVPPRRRALVVDDDPNQRELLAGLLDLDGCDCVTAADGIEALSYLATHDRPHVVLLDMAMPRCDGPETLRRIRADKRLAGLPVFSVSGTDPGGPDSRVGPGGFDAWFPKPIDPRRLCEAIRSVCN